MDVSSMRRRLKSPDVRLRRSVAESAGRHLCDAWPLIPDLICALADEDKFVRRHSVIALGKLGPAAATAVPKLAALLRSEDPVLAEHACWALGMIGAGARKALPLLRRMARTAPAEQDESGVEGAANIRCAAAAAVERIQARGRP